MPYEPYRPAFSKGLLREHKLVDTIEDAVQNLS